MISSLLSTRLILHGPLKQISFDESDMGYRWGKAGEQKVFGDGFDVVPRSKSVFVPCLLSWKTEYETDETVSSDIVVTFPILEEVGNNGLESNKIKKYRRIGFESSVQKPGYDFDDVPLETVVLTRQNNFTSISPIIADSQQDFSPYHSCSCDLLPVRPSTGGGNIS